MSSFTSVTTPDVDVSSAGSANTVTGSASGSGAVTGPPTSAHADERDDDSPADPQHVSSSPLVAQLLYASPAWNGFIKSEEKAKLQSVLNKTARCGFLAEWSPKTIDELLESSDITLFKAALKKSRPRHTPTPPTS